MIGWRQEFAIVVFIDRAADCCSMQSWPRCVLSTSCMPFLYPSRAIRNHCFSYRFRSSGHCCDDKPRSAPPASWCLRAALSWTEPFRSRPCRLRSLA